MATDYDNLKTALQTLANEITDDDVRKYTALILIDQFVDAITTQATSTSSDVISYTIAGRSVTRSQGGASTQMRTVDILMQKINECLYGNVTHADFRQVSEVSAT